MPAQDPTRFAMVPRVDVPRSAFDVRHMHKTTIAANSLTPLYVDEVLPGDSLRQRMTALFRLSTPIVPIMDNVIVESFFFFVPYRLVWANWERFMGEQVNPTDTTAFLVPQVEVTDGDCVPGSMADYFGITLNGRPESMITVSALPWRAYQLIWNDWFRDEDLQDLVTVETDDGPDLASEYTLHPRGKRADYFTSARPWPQKPINAAQMFSGAPLVPGGNMLLPQSGAPVHGIGTQNVVVASPVTVTESGGRLINYDTHRSTGTNPLFTDADATGVINIRVLVNDIRTAMTVQRMMEINARGGTRYAEIVRSHFGVTSPDARLQRPEYLGGGRSFVSINPVIQQSATGATGTTTVLGELAATGTSVHEASFSQSFTEHGCILGLVHVRADLSYQNGTNRMWFRRTPFDFYWPSLAHLGEQAILSREIFSDSTPGDLDVFGYAERWSEYKWKPSRISGMFRSHLTETLDIWHLAQEIDTRPALNSGFITDIPPFDRVLQVQTNASQQFLVDSMFENRWVRCMPMYSVPGLGPRL